MQMWYSDGTPKLRHIAPPGIFIISTFSSQSCQSLVNTSKESIELFECQRKSTSARRVLFELADGLSVFSHTRPPSSLFDQYCSSDSPVNVLTSQLFVEDLFKAQTNKWQIFKTIENRNRFIAFLSVTQTLYSNCYLLIYLSLWIFHTFDFRQCGG